MDFLHNITKMDFFGDFLDKNAAAKITTCSLGFITLLFGVYANWVQRLKRTAKSSPSNKQRPGLINISGRNLFFLLLFLYDCFFVFHLVDFYSAKPATDKTYQPFYGYPQHRMPLDYPLWMVYTHASCALPLVLGSLQFLPFVRRKAMWLHKFLGWVYVVVYVLGSLGPLYMTFSMHCSVYLKAAIWILGIAWAGSTILAVMMVYSKDRKLKNVTLHRQWMARSFLISHTIPLLFRLVWIVAVVVGGMLELPAFELSGWIITIITVPLAELMAFLEVSGKGYVSILSAGSYKPIIARMKQA